MRGPAPPTLLALAFLLIVLVALPAPLGAQGVLQCLGCSFEVDIVAWNGTGDPGSLLIATFLVRNTGEAADRYAITATAEDAAWSVTSEKERTETLDAGSGLFAGPDQSETVSVSIAVPLDARAGATTTLTVTVTSEEMPEDAEGRTKSHNLTATAARVTRWTLDCSEEVQVTRGRDTAVTFAARNLGNSVDAATVQNDPIEDLVPTALPRFELAPQADGTANGTIGASLRLSDDLHTITWRLVDARGAAQATCTTLVTVAPIDTRPAGRDTNDSAGPTLPMVLLLVLLTAHVLRRRA